MDFNFGNPSEIVISRFEEMLKTDKVYFFDSEEFILIIEHYIDTSHLNKARKALQLALEQHSVDIEIQLLQVELHILEEKFEDALYLLNNLAITNPYHEEIYLQRATIYSKKNHHDKAITELKKALEHTVEKSDVYSLLGMEYWFLDDHETAKDYFSECLKIDSEDYTSLNNIVCCYNFLDKTNEAIAFLSQYLEQNPYSEIAWLELARQHYYLEKNDSALICIDFAIYSNDEYIEAYLEKAKILMEEHEYQEAIDHYKYVNRLDLPTALNYLKIGHCYKNMDNLEMSKQYYSLAIQEDMFCDKAWVALSDLYASLGEDIKSKRCISKAIQINSDDAIYWKKYADTHYKLNLYQEAIKAYDMFMKLGTPDLYTYRIIADLYIHTQEFLKAKTLLENTYESHPNDALLEFRLAVVYFQLENIELGKLFLNKALKHEPRATYLIKERFQFILSNQHVLDILKSHKPS